LEAVAGHVEAISPGNPGPELFDLIRTELDDPTAALTHHVVVRTGAERVLVVSLFDVETDLFEDAAVHQQRQGAIHRGFADPPTPFLQHVQNLVGLKVLTKSQHYVEDLPARAGVLDSVITKILAERLP
jgi:hypothetical protein